jgi:hypothetical protein
VLSADVADKRRSGLGGIDVSEGLVLFLDGVRRGHAVAHNHGCRGIVEVNVGVDSQSQYRRETNVLPTCCTSSVRAWRQGRVAIYPSGVATW